MKAVSGPLPTDDGWAFEVKWDGMRVLAEVDDGLRAVSANGIDVTVRFPELAGLVEHLAGHRAVLDGEVAALDDRGRSDFSRLQPRMQTSDPAKVALLRPGTPVTYVVFDLLSLDGMDTTGLPYLDRRRLLAQLVEPGPGRLVPGHVVGGGQQLYDAAVAQGLEGIMAKRVSSTYQPGRRTTEWRKVKVRHRQELVVGGWLSGSGVRSGTIGSLLVGVHEPGRPTGPLRYAGGVGTGFTDAVLDDLHARLAPLVRPDCPFDPVPPRTAGKVASWVDPVLVAEVAFSEWTPDGRVRHASYLGLRIDRDPATVVREPHPADREV